MNVGGDLVLVGASGFGRETAEAVRAQHASGVEWRILGYLDDDPVRHGQIVDGIPVLGGRGLIDQFPGASFVVCTGRPDDYVQSAPDCRRAGSPA